MQKFKTDPSFFKSFTIAQLDKFNAMLKKLGYQIEKRDKQFVSAYFSKVFSSELSAENQEHMTNQEKFDNLEKLYKYAKNRDLSPSLISNLLHELLMLTFKLENYNETLFVEYLDRPLEYSMFLTSEKVQKKQKEKYYQQWQGCLKNV